MIVQRTKMVMPGSLNNMEQIVSTAQLL